MRFLTPCYHPNVDTQGNICLDILKDKWSALYDVRTILLSIQSLLAGGFHAAGGGAGAQVSGLSPPLTPLLSPEPNIESPLNTHAAELWKNQTGECLGQNTVQLSVPLGCAVVQPPTPLRPPLSPALLLSSAYKKYVRETYAKQTHSQDN